MKKRLTLFLFILGVASALISALLTAFIFIDGLDNQIRKDIRKQCETLVHVYPLLSNKNNLLDFAPKDLRITLIDSSGVVLLDSKTDHKYLDSHEDRTEILEAKKTGTGESVRYSTTLKTRMFYYAEKLPDGNILRTSFSLASFDEFLIPLYPIWIILIIILFLISLRISVSFTKKFLTPIQTLTDKLSDTDILDMQVVYSELEPFIDKIREQNEDIRRQISRLERERLRLAAIVQNMAEGLVLLGKDKKILLINEAAKEVFLYEKLPENIEIGIAEAFAGESFTFEWSHADRFFRVIVNPVFKKKEIIGVVCVLIDITAKYASEKMRQDFTANVSHELKTPLTSISGYAEIIEAGFAKPDEIVSFASKIKKEAARLLGLINDIIKLSEVDSPETKLETKKISIKEILEDCKDSLQSNASKKNVSITVDGDNSLIAGDHSMIYELVFNLMDNAIRYNKQNGFVHASFFNGVLKVQDSGIGIPKEHQERIFERFYRVDKSRSKETGGTGLGLAIVKHIAERHHAKIALQSEINEGSEISVTFEIIPVR